MKAKLKNYTNYNVPVTILTEGEENATKEYNVFAIRNKVNQLKEKKCQFTYLSANHDVWRVAINFSIKNLLSFNANPHDIKSMFDKIPIQEPLIA